MEVTRHFTATTVVVHRGRVLLHRHKKLGMWLPVGGHIDRDELPHEAALREVTEETGLTVELYNPDPPIDFGDAHQLMRPMHILLENINQFHQHIDFIYYATAHSDDFTPEDGDNEAMKWFTHEELDVFPEAPIGVKKIAHEALDILG